MEQMLTSNLSIILGCNNETIQKLLDKINELEKKNEKLEKINEKLNNKVEISEIAHNIQIESLRNINRIINEKYVELKNKKNK